MFVFPFFILIDKLNWTYSNGELQHYLSNENSYWVYISLSTLFVVALYNFIQISATKFPSIGSIIFNKHLICLDLVVALTYKNSFLWLII